MLRKIWYKLKLIWHGLFYGLSGAEKFFNGVTNQSDGIEVTQRQSGGGVFADLLEEKQTQEVKETIDTYYRVYKKSDEYDTSVIKIIGEDENGVIFAPINRLKKKTKADFIQCPPIFNPDGANVITIQDNKHYEDNYNTNPSFLYKYETTLKVSREEFTPRFEIDKIVKKIVVREHNYGKVLVDLYVPSEASQFGKIDAIVISNLYSLKNEKKYKSDLIDFIGFEWVSDKAWNTEDIRLFKYKVNDLIGINIFDGSFVLTYYCDIIENGSDLTEKYKTKELDEKYAKEAPKRDDIDIFTYSRKMERDKKNKEIDLENLSTNKLKLD